MKRFFFVTIVICFMSPLLSNHLSAQDPPIDMYINSWKNSLPEVSHGTMVERAILMPGDVNHPSRPGAVLTFAKKFARGLLESYVQTTPTKHTGEEEILYIMKGRGRIEAGLKKAELIEGTGVLIPPDVEHTIINENSEPLEMLVLVDDFPASKVPPKEIVVKNYHSLPVSAGGHWCHIARSLFSQGDGMGGFYSILLVSVDGMNIPEPHPHGTGDEEGWCAIKGRSLLFLGKEIRWQDEGTAFIIPQDAKTPHSNINPGNDPVMFFYFRTFKKLEK